ncbi:TlpA family protein disulfide reductase [Chitinophaga sp. RAB17]|uniref:TlpA family protein disulfide reductase n=1 Tax=Chitinophaga sp. RAB17 TaxID=3233049 RepID=UPI003F8F77A9
MSVTFVLSCLNVNAQEALHQVQQTIDKIESYDNFSYQYILKQKEYTSDTLIIQYNDIFSKAPEDKNFGYLFNRELTIKGNKFPSATLYNGQKLMSISYADSSYTMKAINAHAIQGSLLEFLKNIKGFIVRKPSEIVGDTTINNVTCSHLIVNTYDTIINKEHFYTSFNLFFEKSSDMLNCVIIKSRSTGIGDGISDYYSATRYTDYKFNQDNIDISSMTIPQGFQQEKERSALLGVGEVAPNWTLSDANGKKMSLTQMKGKVVMMDFFFIGCGPCMRSLKPLNNLHEKYKNQQVAMASITNRDSKKAILEFQQQYKIKNPVYINADDVVKSYHVTGFPTFYFIDKEGKVAAVIEGYEDNFEEKAISIINDLLGKK